MSIEFRPGNRDELFLEVARELVRDKVDLLLAAGIDATIAAKNAPSTIPIVTAQFGGSTPLPPPADLLETLSLGKRQSRR